MLLRGLSLGYLGLMVVLPLTVLAIQALQEGPGAILKEVTNPFAWHALTLSFATAGIMVLINAVVGTATAWVLVRVEFPGKGFVNALIDLPFAVPTVVTGLMLVVLYGPGSVLETIFGGRIIFHQPGIVLALLFVTYPFVVRSVQPVLLEMDRTEEEAAVTLGAGGWWTFRKVVLPALRPAILTGSAQAFSRALGEFGSVILVAGNRPLETTTAPMYVYAAIEGGQQHAALAVSFVLLMTSLAILIGLILAQRRGDEHG